jgi:hypothetical protein
MRQRVTGTLVSSGVQPSIVSPRTAVGRWKHFDQDRADRSPGTEDRLRAHIAFTSLTIVTLFFAGMEFAGANVDRDGITILVLLTNCFPRSRR